YGVDFPRGVFPTLEPPVLEDVAADLWESLKARRYCVAAHGFWPHEDRAKWRAIGTQSDLQRERTGFIPPQAD
ncbi:ATP/GTP-binding protein, partial [Streptomyces sp. NRRL B-1140]